MKKGKKKEEKFSLADFLVEEGVGSSIPIYKEIENISENGKSTTSKIDISSLPTAPKSSFVVTVNEDVINRGPPYVLYAKNIPFDSSEDDIVMFFEGLQIHKTRIILQDNRPVGIAAVSFNDLKEYISALERDGLKMGNRCVTLTQEQKIRFADERKPFSQHSKKYDFGSRADDQTTGRKKSNQTQYTNVDEDTEWRVNRESSQPDEKQWRRGETQRNIDPQTGSNSQTSVESSNWRNRCQSGDGQSSSTTTTGSGYFSSKTQGKTGPGNTNDGNIRKSTEKDAFTSYNNKSWNRDSSQYKNQGMGQQKFNKKPGFNFGSENSNASEGSWETVSRK